MRFKSFIPNTLTLLNALSGCMALLSVVSQDYKMTLTWILIGVFFDSTDGLFARGLKVTSEIGKQLDSLSDVISFGVVPGFFLNYYLAENLPYDYVFLSPLGFLVTLAAVYRLARFNITPSSQLDFEGMPTPAFALFVVGIPFLPIDVNYEIVVLTTSLLALLMVSKLMLPSQKFVHGRPSAFALIFALIVIPVLVFYKAEALSAVILSYGFFGTIYMRIKG